MDVASSNGKVPLLFYPALRGMLDVDDVAVLNDVILGLLPHQAGSFDLALAAQADDVGDGHGLGADEAAGKVGVDTAGGFDGATPLADEPRADFFFAGGEENHLAGG